MPIVRTYACEECGHFMDVTLRLDQADDPAPMCPRCTFGDAHHYGDARMQQEFKPFSIGGSHIANAHKLAETIANEDYGVADIQREYRRDGTPKHRFKDQGNPSQASTWGAANAAIEQAIAFGRQTRLQGGGSGLDVLQAALKSGEQADLIEVSKKRSMRVW